MSACQAAGFSPVPLFELSDPATVRFLAHAGLGISVVPASWLEQPGPDVAVAKLAEPAPRHRVALLVAAGRETPAGRLLRAALLEDLG
jgi:DNA-binding transcriptional LysR family regulator